MQKVGTTQRPNIEPWEQDIPEGTPFVTTQAGNRIYNVDSIEEAEEVERLVNKLERGECRFTPWEEVKERLQQEKQRLYAEIRAANVHTHTHTVETAHTPSPTRRRVPVPYEIEEPELWIAAEPQVAYKTRQAHV